jgi:predicted RNA-binding Zn ribbon-like protein
MATTSEREWVWYGGRSSIDFVNTRRDREGHGVEYLRAIGDLAAWFTAAGFTSYGLDAAVLADALRLREAIDAAVAAAVTNAPAPTTAVRELNVWLARHPAHLRIDDGMPVLEPSAASSAVRQVLGSIALDAAQLIASPARARLRICAGPHCGGRFLDDSPAGRRRWCSMAVCGNRAKAAAHRQSQR